MKKSKHVLIFSGYFLPFLGGIERYTHNLSKELIKQGYKVSIVCTNHNNLLEKEVIDKITVYRLPSYNLFKQRYPIIKKNKEYKKIINEILNNEYNFIICNTRFQLTTFIGKKISKIKNIPIIILDHGSDHFSVGNKILDYCGAKYEHFLTYRLKKHIKNYYGVSKKCSDWLKHFKINAKGIIYNSIDGNNYSKYKSSSYLENGNKVIITYAGRLIKEKGLYLLCDAYSDLKYKYSDVELYVAGDGPILDDLKNKYPNVNFLGKLNFDEIMALYNDTTIFVYPSMFPEGLPTSILEAGLMKSLVIATDRGGTKEVIKDDSLGFIMEENKESLIVILDKILKNKDSIVKYQNNIHKHIINNFTWEVTVNKLIKEMERYNNEKDC